MGGWVGGWVGLEHGMEWTWDDGAERPQHTLARGKMCQLHRPTPTTQCHTCVCRTRLYLPPSTQRHVATRATGALPPSDPSVRSPPTAEARLAPLATRASRKAAAIPALP